MNLHIELLSWEAYRRFLTAPDCAPVPLYHQPLWLKAVEDGLRMRVVVLGLYEGQELIGVVPGFLARKGPVRLFGSPLRGSMTPYLGWVYRRGRALDTETTLDLVYRFCRRTLGCHYVEIGLADPAADRANGRPPAGWHVHHPETYVVDLRPGEAALWKGLKQRERQKVNKARKVGVVIEPVTDRRLMDDFHAMLEASFGRHGVVSPHPKAFFLALYDRLVASGRMEMVAATHEGRAVAMGMFLSNEHEMHFVSGAAFSDALHLRPNNLLHWHMMTRAVERGLVAYDLGTKGTPSIDQFKESFGPAVHTFTFFWRATPLVTIGWRVALRALPTLLAWRYRARRLLHQDQGKDDDHAKAAPAVAGLPALRE